MTQNRPYGDYFPYGINLRVPNMEFAADVNLSGSPYVVNFGAPLALAAAGMVNASQNVNGSATTINTFTSGAGSATAIGYNGMVPFSSTTKRDGWGRNLTCVASGACTRTVTVTGRDYLGQVMVEVLTLNGTTTVQGLKAFAWIESIVIASDTDTATVNVGYGNKLGLPYAAMTMGAETKDGAVAANAATFVGALADATAATNTNADVRGTYLPVTVIPDGTHTFEAHFTLRRGNLHGNAQPSS